VRYGNSNYKRYNINQLRQEKRLQVRPLLQAEYDKYKTPSMQAMSDKKIKYIEDCYFSAVFCKTMYEKSVGPQD